MKHEDQNQQTPPARTRKKVAVSSKVKMVASMMYYLGLKQNVMAAGTESDTAYLTWPKSYRHCSLELTGGQKNFFEQMIYL